MSETVTETTPLPCPAKIAGYLMPNPARGSADATRLRHGDLRAMSDPQLEYEIVAVTDAYFGCVGQMVGVNRPNGAAPTLADEWLLARIYQIEAEQRDRRKRSRR